MNPTLTWIWLRWEAGRRRRSLAVLVVLAAVSGGVVMTAVAASRRGDSALDRLADGTRPATAYLANYTPGFDWAAVRDFPEVEALTTFVSASGFSLAGVPDDDYAVWFPPADTEGMSTIERPHVIAGRLADPARADEAVVTSRFLDSYGFAVGDTLTARLYSPEQIEDVADPGAPTGPALPIRITGVVRSTWYSDEPDNKGKFFPSPAVFARYPASFGGDGAALAALVRLEGGAAAVPAFSARLAGLDGGAEVNIRRFDQYYRPERASARFDAACMSAFALASLAAAVLLLGQATARYAAAGTEDLAPLRALGLTGPGSVALACIAPVTAGLAGAGLGTGLAVVASRWFPIGTAAPYEPDPGIRIDWAVLAAGAVGLVLLVAAGAAAGAALVIRRSRIATRGTAASGFPATGSRPARASCAVASACERLGLPVSVVVGTRYALERGRPGNSVPVRSTLVAAVVGIGGTLAALTFSAGAAEAAGNPVRFGQDWPLVQFYGFDGQTLTPGRPLLDVAAADPDVVGVNDTRIGAARPLDGRSSLAVFSYAPFAGRVDITLTAGRQPSGNQDVVLAPDTATAMEAGVGDRVTLQGDRGARELTVSGIGFVPHGIDNGYNLGAWVSGASFDQLFAGYTYRFSAIELRDGADVDVVQKRLNAAMAPLVTKDSDVTVEPNEGPGAAVREVESARSLPNVFAGLVALLAAGAIGHALVLGIQRRGPDLAVMRAVGMTRRQVRSVVRVQAVVPVVVGLVFGLPLGTALGRVLWRAVAAAVPVQFVPPTTWTALLLALPLGLGVAWLLAAGPARRVSGARVADVLRAE